MGTDSTRPRRPRRDGDGPAREARQARIFELAGAIGHGDTDQLNFQISEIAGDLTYEQGGVTVNPGDTVIDAGANYGVSAVHFALQCGAGAVHSFEPVPETFEILSRNLAGFPACTPHRLGLAAAEGTAEITYFTGGDSVMSGLNADPERIREKLSSAGRNFGLSESKAEEMASLRCEPHTARCRLTTVSAFMRSNGIERVDLLKIDVEGSELEVLSGIEDAEWPKIRQIAGEIHEDHLLESIEAMLAEWSFTTVVTQDPLLSGTPIRLLYAVR